MHDEQSFHHGIDGLCLSSDLGLGRLSSHFDASQSWQAGRSSIAVDVVIPAKSHFRQLHASVSTLRMSLCSFHTLPFSCFGSCQDDTRNVLACDLYFLCYRGIWRRRHPHMNDTSRRIDADYI